jgi:hypothetical protein
LRKKVTIEIDEIVYRLLEVLTCGRYAPVSVENVIEQLIDHTQQGVYRPGSWEREWLRQVFGEDWIAHLEPGDPYGRPNCELLFRRPKRRRDR